MNQLQTFKRKASDLALSGYCRAAVVIGSFGPVAALAQATDPVETALGDAKEKILGYIAVAGLGIIAIALAKVGFMVVSKWIARFGSKS